MPLQNQNNPRVLPLTQVNQDVVSPEQIHIQIQDPPLTQRPPITSRVSRQVMYYVAGAVLEPQEPRYSSLCVVFSIGAAFLCGMMLKKCS